MVLKDGQVTWPITLNASQQQEGETRGQHTNEKWQQLHRHIVTASNFKKVCRSRGNSELLLSSLFDAKSLDHIPAIRHGREHEQSALDAYKSWMADRGKVVHIRSCGVAVHTQFGFIGASPDGMVFDPSVQPRFGLVEIKCPYTAFRDSLTVQQACRQMPDFCCKVDDNGVITLRRDHAYFFQVQGQMAVSGAKWCDFVVWIGKEYVCRENPIRFNFVGN